MPSSDDSDNGRLLIRLDERTKRIEGKLDEICVRQEKQNLDHEQRLRKLEQQGPMLWARDVAAYIATAVAAAVAAVVGQK